MENLPLYLPATFVTIALAAIWMLYKASAKNNTMLAIILLWLIIQSALSLSGFYTVTHTLPPRFMLLLLPPIAFLIALFIILPGRRFIDTLNPRWLTAIHILRILVEVGLYGLFIHKTVPRIMTFEGRNLDILSGIIAILILYFGYYKSSLNRSVLLTWNFIGLALLANIVIVAVLSGPFRFQQFGFEQPNTALLYFPYALLPGIIVPAVLFAHIVCIRQLLHAKVDI